MANTEKNSYTLLFAVLMVVVVGSVLAGLFGSLNGQIKENQKKEKKQNILFAMGITKATISKNQDDADLPVDASEADKIFEEYVGDNQFIIEGIKATKTNKAFDIDVKKQGQLAKKDGYVRKLPLFIGSVNGKKSYVVPLYGKGLWDAIWGYVALEEDLKTVKGAFFDHKGETPGLGANIKEKFFYSDFKGESIYSGAEFKGITVAKGNNDPTNQRKDDNKVDAIAGATITGDGVTAMIKADIKMYVPYFETVKPN
ncbi:NADH:ubiquinone reductase (Na(+)-transporting) subunit C [Aquimarina agarivorans]|uniref:NADH:ubiquinone reductase (Na(+)-transporting) subunit C n=1 Tax=Aquimarina agarivorans TaxID=980584 RepID=UPI000248FB5B|nr:NADH:ubiquinone reductase (Na(+)-transporting) subunit C [Aquimarina agarivorans]